ncbi:MAG: glycosyltransferase family 39 protein [Chloroflexi bacterium]|nr:glycosyltransferase family 39 protein [Chloroflexota bacterium]
MSILNGLRKHWLFCLGFPLLLVVMSWPTVVYVFDANVFWLPTTNKDAWMKFWDAWYLRFIAADPVHYLFTDMLFHPKGLSLVYHNFSFPHMLLFSALQNIMPASNAFNLCFLIIIGLNGAAAYTYINYRFHEPLLGLFGALVFALSPFVLSQPHHPDVIFIAVVPLSLYCLERGVGERRWLYIGLAGFFIASSLFIGMYIYVCLVITTALFLLFYAARLWSSPAFWRRVFLLALIVGIVSLARVYPLIENSASFTDALDKPGGDEWNTDLVASFVNWSHPLAPTPSEDEARQARQYLDSSVYLGYLPLVLIGAGLLRGADRRVMAPWLLLLLVFFVLRLGSVLQVGGQRYDWFILPKHFLDQLLPTIFKPFWDTSLFHIGAALPLALLACYGARSLLRRLPAKMHVPLLIFALLFTAFEFWRVISPQVKPDDALRFLARLRAEEDQDQIRLIHLPMGRHDSKVYGYYQSLTGYPHVEGLASRTPPSAYDYINENLLLKNWRRYAPVICLPANRDRYLAAQEQLLADGFTHIVFHHQRASTKPMSLSFISLPPAYEDAFARIYHVRQLAEACAIDSIPLPDAFSYIGELAQSEALIADEGISILSFHPFESLDDESLRYLTAVFESWKSFEHVVLRDGQLQAQSLNADRQDLSRWLAGGQLLVLTYDPSQAKSEAFQSLTTALAADFRRCQQIVETAGAAYYYVRKDFACELLSSANKFAATYDNGLRLANLLYDYDRATLKIDLWWTDKPSEAHAVSIQIFDAEDNKVAGKDFTVGVEPLARYQVDLSTLEDGDYIAKLIVYNYETRASVAGLIAKTQTRFERELEIGAFTIE